VDRHDTAQLVAGVLMVLFVLVLARIGRRDLVATDDGSYTDAGGTTRNVKRGQVIRAGDATLAAAIPTRPVRRSWLGAILVGQDHRASTSKTVVAVWTFLIGWGLLSAVLTSIFGADVDWPSLQEEYLLLLGGPFAAAVLAKYATSGQAESKPDGPVGDAGPSQLVTNDSGDTDLGDFQYVLFNVIGMAFFLSQFSGELSTGFPDLPPTLTGLMLTSTGAYAAKKLLAQEPPTLISVLPAAAPRGAAVEVYGTSLTVPASASESGEAAIPTVLVGNAPATVTAHDIVLGNDRLTITIPDTATLGSAPISVTRADGVRARDATGVDRLPFEVLL
jgi:hypothetical protein